MGFHSKLVALAVLSPATLVQAIATFAITNIDDIVVLAVMFGQAPGHDGGAGALVLGGVAHVHDGSPRNGSARMG